jgi:hypothetical protein
MVPGDVLNTCGRIPKIVWKVGASFVIDLKNN